MKLEEIPEVPVEEVTPQREYTEEEKKQLDEFYEMLAKKQLYPRVADITHYMRLTHKKLDDVYNDIDVKKSGLSSLNRKFLTSFDRPFINSLFEKKYL